MSVSEPPNIPPVPEDLQREYSNFVLIEPGPMDATITFGHQVGGAGPYWSVRVTMPWEELKFFASALEQHVGNYQQSYGEVRDVMARAAEQLKTQADQAAKDLE